MHLLPSNMRLALATSSCTLILLALALAASAVMGQPELIVLAAAALILAVIGSSLLLGWQAARLLRDQKRLLDRLTGRFAIFENAEPTARVQPPARFPARAPVSQPDDGIRHAQRIEALNRLRDGIVHDLNNRLMVISANVDAVARQIKDQPSLQRRLLSALVASDQAASLIARSNDFARPQELNVQYVDLAERIDSIAAFMGRSLLRDTVGVRVSLDDGLWQVRVDPNDLETAVVTLCARIRDTLSQGETITIEARNMAVSKETLPRADLEGEFVRISIGSRAAGDAPQDADERPESVFTMQDTDLASWIEFNRSLHFVQALGGMAEVVTIGEKSAFALYLPRAKAPALIVPAAAREEDVGETVQDRTEVLVVDDEIEVAIALQGMLEEFGYVVRVATDAGQAMKSLRVRRPDLVLMDVTMPGATSGVALAREVRQIFPGTPVLLITGNPVVSGNESEFPLLRKPIVSRNLHAAIQRHLTPGAGKVVSLFPRASRRMR